MSTSAEPLPWFGQPRGLTVLFLTNMWEQFSYYGMRALLMYYMTKQLLLGQENASTIYGLYTACAYFTPILGGAIADRWLGKRNAIILGGSIMAAGHFMMAFEPLFYAALATIAIGNGLFLPSLPSQIGDLYKPGDERAGWAYNVYYVGVNIGGFLAPLICGTLGELYGWHYGFGAAGIGVVAGLAIYIWGQRYLPERERRVTLAEAAPATLPSGRSLLWLLLTVALAVTIFRGAYEQLGNTVALWADTGVDKQVAAWSIPMTWFISLNPLFVMLMTPFLLRYWRRRSEAGAAERPAQRMAMGALIVGAAYALLAVLAFAADGGRTAWPWFVLFFVVLTFGELFILPTGLGLFARRAPRRIGSTTVAAWFLATFAGSLLAGFIGRLWSQLGAGQFFVLLTGLCVVAAAILATLDRVSARDRVTQPA